VLPKSYEILAGTLLKELLKRVSEIPATIAFSSIYEYFIGEFAKTEGSKGGEFTRHPASCASWSNSSQSIKTSGRSL
jgi:hypothetical protein